MRLTTSHSDQRSFFWEKLNNLPIDTSGPKCDSWKNMNKLGNPGHSAAMKVRRSHSNGSSEIGGSAKHEPHYL